MNDQARVTLPEVLAACEVFGRLVWELAQPAPATTTRDDREMNLRETAQLLGVSPGFIKGAITRGELKAARIAPKFYRVRASAAEAFRRERETA